MTRTEALEALARMPDRLDAWARSLRPEALRVRPLPEEFAPLEHLWHLAELEEIFALRLQRLRDEDHPHLADFHGDTAAVEGRYRERDVEGALHRFRQARSANLAAFAALTEAQWHRGGTQEAVGEVVLADLPGRMADHDQSHTLAFQEP
ncbi:MAG TPA: DinB family protein [Holophagaceae bacterium]|nr:DinB family protein [Holophagaceae bacterium]